VSSSCAVRCDNASCARCVPGKCARRAAPSGDSYRLKTTRQRRQKAA
jgi:hypothetical protein